MERSEINCYQALLDYFISQISPLFALKKNAVTFPYPWR